ncbi:MAG: DNA topoisomerase (ATP-hydrolyzing) subunit A [Cyanobacteria bacterium P01_H01_bin.15]
MTFSADRIIPTDLSNEMSRSYLEYAMSVIVGRALPDARDGLKPVHRRILYAMYELGLTHDRPFRKCARVVGEVLGKYHPHGDTAVYDALVRMAQDFSMRDPLIEGHGNFGSVDNDPPAAMRYTESRLRALTVDALIQDIEADTVDFADNFDGSQQEPIVLPTRIPQLLLNGSSGIAVGMATNIPPHNLGELIDGVVALIENPELSSQDLMRFIPGPDFPTGGQILGRDGIREAYLCGRGSITMRGVAEVETIEAPGRADREAIIVTQLPFQTNKASLIERIAEMVNEKRMEGISDIRDESDRDGMRIVIELKRDAYPRVVLNNLYKHTPLQTNFGANMLALVGNDPQTLGLKDFLTNFLEFRIETIIRRTRYHLRKAQERDHLLQGLLTALGNLDGVIALIRGAADTATAKAELIEQFGLSEAQADAILQMQLRRLTALEAEKIEAEHQDLQRQILDYEDILARRERVDNIIREEVLQVKTKFATPRRTEIVAAEGDLDATDLIANEQAIILLTEQGYIKRMPVSAFDAQNRNTRGKAGARIKDDDMVEHFLACCDHDSILFFTDRGVVYRVQAYRIPMGSRTARGIPVVQLLPISREEKITSMVPVSEFTDDEYLLMLTQQGFIKKTTLSAFANIRTNGLIAISLQEGDQLRWVRLCRQTDSAMIGSLLGMSIHFPVDHQQLRPLGRATRGVRSMKLRDQDEVMSLTVIPSEISAGLDATTAEDTEDIDDDAGVEDAAVEADDGKGAPWVLAVTAEGYGKRVPLDQFRLQNRAGMGIKAIKFRSESDRLVAIRLVQEDDEMMVITNRGIIIRQAVKDISLQSRMATGVRVQRLDDEDAIAAVALIPPPQEGAEDLNEEEDADADAVSENGGEETGDSTASAVSPAEESAESEAVDEDTAVESEVTEA